VFLFVDCLVLSRLLQDLKSKVRLYGFQVLSQFYLLELIHLVNIPPLIPKLDPSLLLEFIHKVREFGSFDYFLSFETNLNLPLLHNQALSHLNCWLCIFYHFGQGYYILRKNFDLLNKLASPVCGQLLNCSLVLGNRESTQLTQQNFREKLALLILRNNLLKPKLVTNPIE
jgi:hypothetical protein